MRRTALGVALSSSSDLKRKFGAGPTTTRAATRIEVRVADGAANPYLAIAAVLSAGGHGLREGLRPPSPVHGDA